MSIDYDGVGGIGIEVTERVLKKLISAKLFTRKQWNEDFNECLKKIGLLFSTAGNFYCGDDLTHYLFVPGNNLQEILDNEEAFKLSLEKFGINVSRKDLLMISEYKIH